MKDKTSKTKKLRPLNKHGVGSSKPVVANLKIHHCKDCPFVDKQRHYTADSFEMEFNWHCKKQNNKVIAHYVSWNEERDVKSPQWCPLSK